MSLVVYFFLAPLGVVAISLAFAYIMCYPRR